MSKMFMNVKEVMEVLEVSESYAYKLMKRLNRELQAMGCQTIAGKVDRKYFYEQFYGTRSNDGNFLLDAGREVVRNVDASCIVAGTENRGTADTVFFCDPVAGFLPGVVVIIVSTTTFLC